MKKILIILAIAVSIVSSAIIGVYEALTANYEVKTDIWYTEQGYKVTEKYYYVNGELMDHDKVVSKPNTIE